MLKIKNLTMSYKTRKGFVRALRNIDFELEDGDIVGLVGESGCGKSTLLLAIMKLIPDSAVIESGEIVYEGEDLLLKSSKEMRDIRGKDIAMIFQDPMTTLNPVFRVGDQICEALRVHNMAAEHKALLTMEKTRKKVEQKLALDLMKEVEIPSPDTRYVEYPYEFSGGMQQRALIAMALSCQPKLLLADEPTTALDVTVQAQIMELLGKINKERQTAIILVTHDLALAAEFCSRLVIMYAGEIVEEGRTDEVIGRPLHPYTRGLLNSIPKIGSKAKIHAIPGTVPDLMTLTEACPFAPRCDCQTEECSQKIELIEIEEGRYVRCSQNSFWRSEASASTMIFTTA